MKKKLRLFCLLTTVLASSTIVNSQKTNRYESITSENVSFEEKKGFVEVEAELFYKQTKSDIRQWYRTSKNESPNIKRDDDEQHYLNASNNGYIEILPDSRVSHDDELIRGENFSDIPGVAAVVHYKVKINTPGRYYVWVRTFATGTEDNGIHVGIDNEWPEHGRKMQWCEGRNQWTWGSKQRTKQEHCGVPKEIYLDIKEAGIHDIQFSMREDGFEFDKFILTSDINYNPAEGSITSLVAVKPPKGRIAIVADGNSPDPDDLGGTAVSIALLRATGLADRLVHYSHSCDLVRVSRISEKAERERHALMQAACDVTARRWGGFDNLTFFDAKWQKKETINDLRNAINISTKENPLWIIEAGEPDIIGMALDTSKKSKHQFVKVVTHHPANDDAGDSYSWQDILDFGIEEVRIPDQNINLKVNIEKWDWAKNHTDPRIQWVWIQGKIAEVDDVVKFQKGKWDCSDAGMVLYWITGAKNEGLKLGSVENVKKILLDYVE